MPLFKYRCLDCQEEFEELVPFSLSHEMECPSCSSKNTEKLVSSFATIGSSTAGTSVGSCGSGPGGFS
jgi:putative FmdB family regulatory protein